MSIYTELDYSSQDIDTIEGIQFSVKSAEQIRRDSHVEINKSDAINNNQFVPNGLYDPRMGVTDFNQTCPTCFQKNNFCPGHFGHIELESPVFHVQFYNTVTQLLHCICPRCSRLVIDPEGKEVKTIMNKKLPRHRRWEEMFKLCKDKKRCGGDDINGCGLKMPKITREEILRIGFEWKEEGSTKTNSNVNKKILSADDVYSILKRIPDDVVGILGFCDEFTRPESLICRVLPVPPPHVRPSARSDTGMRQEDDLTHKFASIIKANKNLAKVKKENKSQDIIVTHENLLQWEVATMVDPRTKLTRAPE
jgi:DNA-directed RNA polymerase II subunit RPB1